MSRYRALSEDYDYTFGAGVANFLVDTPAMVAQSVLTRLRLWRGEWFLDVTEGTPWMQEVLSADIKNTKSLYDLAIQNRVLQTAGVVSISNYSSSVPLNEDGTPSRKLSISMSIDTLYGTTDEVKVTL